MDVLFYRVSYVNICSLFVHLSAFIIASPHLAFWAPTHYNLCNEIRQVQIICNQIFVQIFLLAS